jgi:hypothetical protein
VPDERLTEAVQRMRASYEERVREPEL